MNLRQILNFLVDVENSFPVNDWSVGGVRIWPYLRCGISNKLNHASLDVREAGGRPARAWQRKLRTVTQKGVRNLRTGSARLRAERLNPPYGDIKGAVVAFGDGVSFVEMAGKQFEKNLEPLLEGVRRLGVDTLMLTPGYSFPAPCSTPQRFIQAGMDVVASRGILGPVPRFSDVFLEGLNECLGFVNAFCGRTVLTLTDLFKGLGHIFRFADYFSSILAKHSACLGVYIDYEGEGGMGFALACHRLGIPSMVMPHGDQPVDNPLAHDWNAVPPGGYELLPDVFWLRSQEEADRIKQWTCGSEGGHRVIVGGNTFLESWLNGSVPDIHLYDEQIVKGKGSSEQGIRILVAMNGLTEEESSRLGEVIEAAVDAGLEGMFWVRGHPVRPESALRLKDKLSEQAVQRCRFNMPTAMPLYALLRHTDVVLTMFSSTVTEARRFGVRSIAIDANGPKLFSGLAECGILKYSDQPDEIVSLIALQAQKKERQVARAGSGFDGALSELMDIVNSYGAPCE